MFSNKMDFSFCVIWIDFHKSSQQKYAKWDHMFLREASFPVGFVAACRRLIHTATVITLVVVAWITCW